MTIDGKALHDRLIEELGIWGECGDYPRANWRSEVSNEDTQLGYWDWVIAQHDLGSVADADAAAPMRIERDRDGYASWWNGLADTSFLEETVLETLPGSDSISLAEGLQSLMIDVFQRDVAPVNWLAVTGLSAGTSVRHVGLDIEPSYDSTGVLDGVNVVLSLTVSIAGSSAYQTITVYVDRPERVLVPEPLDDVSAAVAEIVDIAAELVTAELAERVQFFRIARGSMAKSDERLVCEQDARQVINGVADDVLEAAGMPETGITDAVNLVVNGSLHRLFTDADATLEEIVAECYSDDVTVDEVVRWLAN